MKVALFVALIAGAIAATVPLTQAQCDANTKADFASATDVCTECKGNAMNTGPCKVETDRDAATATAAQLRKQLECVALQQCYAKIEEDKAKQASEKMAAKYGKYCPTDKAKCADKDGYCPTWANAKPSQCTENPEWMLQNCANSCCPICTGKNTLAAGSCPLKDREDLCVKNTHSSCNDWAIKTPRSECDVNPTWMKVNCMQSCCDTCKKAKDGCPTVKVTCKNDYALPDATAGSAKCGTWAKAGECTSNPVWMKKNCAKECCPICVPVAPARATVAQPRVVYQQPFQQLIQQQPVRIQQPVYQQPVQRFQQPVYQQQQLFGGYQTGLPYRG